MHAVSHSLTQRAHRAHLPLGLGPVGSHIMPSSPCLLDLLLPAIYIPHLYHQHPRLLLKRSPMRNRPSSQHYYYPSCCLSDSERATNSRCKSLIFMWYIASSGHPKHLYDVVPRYGDRCQVQRATCSSYHQTYTSIPFPKHATTIADFAFDPSIPHLTSFYAHTCITTIRSLHRQLANKPSPDQRFRTRSPPSIAHIRERPADSIMLS